MTQLVYTLECGTTLPPYMQKLVTVSVILRYLHALESVNTQNLPVFNIFFLRHCDKQPTEQQTEENMGKTPRTFTNISSSLF